MSTFQNTYKLRDTMGEAEDYSIPDKIYPESQDSTPEERPNLDLSPSNNNVVEEVPVKLPLISPFLKPLQKKYQLLQLWEGRVLNVTGGEFEAIISDKTNHSLPDEIVIIDREELSNDDLPLLKPGAVFYWSVGYVDLPGRGRSRESKIRFRRLRGWTDREIERAKEFGERLEKLFNQLIE